MTNECEIFLRHVVFYLFLFHCILSDSYVFLL